MFTLEESNSNKGVSRAIPLKEWVEISEYLKDFKDTVGHTTSYIESAIKVCDYVLARQVDEFATEPQAEVFSNGLKYLLAMYNGQERFTHAISLLWMEKFSS